MTILALGATSFIARQRFASLLDSLGSVAGLADQLNVFLFVQDHLQAAAEQRVIVNDHRANRLGKPWCLRGRSGSLTASIHDASSHDPPPASQTAPAGGIWPSRSAA
jgi:hypothetical protein